MLVRGVVGRRDVTVNKVVLDRVRVDEVAPRSLSVTDGGSVIGRRKALLWLPVRVPCQCLFFILLFFVTGNTYCSESSTPGETIMVRL